MDEYEDYEKELQQLYETYMDKFRNQAYLEQILEQQNRIEQDRIEVSSTKETFKIPTFVFSFLSILVCVNSVPIIIIWSTQIALIFFKFLVR